MSFASNIQGLACNHTDTMFCEYFGTTGLELFPQTQGHNIQRKPIAKGSLFLLTQVRSNEYGDFKSCWGITESESQRVYIACSNEENFKEDTPDVIKELIQ